MRSSLDIVVVNWNAGELLRACLASIGAAVTERFELRRVVIVDNDSQDGSLDGLEELGLPLTLIRNQTNRGFGPACNQGARESDADYVLFLNPDTRLLADSLDVPLAWMDRPENAGVAVSGVQLVDESGRVARSCARFPRLSTYLWIATGIDRLLKNHALGYRMSEWDHTESRDVDHVMGAFYLTRRCAFDSVGGFDEDFFVYFEDLDLSRRLASAGHRAHYLADASAFHLGGGTTRAVKARRLAYFLRGKLRYARKHHALFGAFFAAATILLVELPSRCLGALVARRPRDAAATLGAYRLLLSAETAAQSDG